MQGPAPTDGPLTLEELQLAARNRGLPLEALRYDVTPVGLHYLLVHFDIPALDPRDWRLAVGGTSWSSEASLRGDSVAPSVEGCGVGGAERGTFASD